MVLCQQNHCLHPAGAILQKWPQAVIYTSLSVAPGKGEGQQSSGRKAARESAVTQHFLFCIKLGNYSMC